MAASDHHQNHLTTLFPVIVRLSFSCWEDCEISSTLAAATRFFSSTPLPMARVDFEIVSLVDFVSPEAPFESCSLAPSIVEARTFPVAFETPAAVSDSRFEPSFVAVVAVSETLFMALSLARTATFCVLSRVWEAACWADSVTFLAVSRAADDAFLLALFAASSAAAFDDSRADAARSLNRSKKEEKDLDEGKLFLSSSERRRDRVVEQKLWHETRDASTFFPVSFLLSQGVY
mmetsp:Transcript_8242/g.24342  ORF Transcript_8242/g.24342 Transcript_8242/m.24342 type:complete len:233 (-) Transcript_8242:284-982(-)